MFKLPKEYEEKMKKENELKYVILEDGTEKHISEFNNKSINLDEFKGMRMNSYSRNDIYPKLTDETLLHEAKYYISQCSEPRTISTYNDAITHLILPELIKRYKQQIDSDTSKEESSIYYYNEMKRLEDEVKFFKGYESPKYFNLEE